MLNNNQNCYGVSHTLYMRGKIGRDVKILLGYWAKFEKVKQNDN